MTALFVQPVSATAVLWVVFTVRGVRMSDQGHNPRAAINVTVAGSGTFTTR